MSTEATIQTASEPAVACTSLLADETCQTCKFWMRCIEQPEDDDNRADLGWCRRHAPIARGWREWPTTLEGDLCGDYRPKANK